jgi:acetyl-CoA acetyltransferase
LSGAKEQAGFDTSLVEDIVVGTCHAPSPCYEARASALAAGFAEHTPVQSLNRLCGSGLMAIRAISDSVARGDIEIGLAVGVESMSSKYVFCLSDIRLLLIYHQPSTNARLQVRGSSSQCSSKGLRRGTRSAINQ